MAEPQFNPTQAGTRQELPKAAYASFSAFLQLERSARHAQTPEALRYVMVNETKRLLDYRQAALALFVPPAAPRIEAIAGVAILERNAPFLRWQERVMAQRATTEQVARVHPVEATDLALQEREEWSEWSAAHGLWVPLKTPDEQLIGALWLARDKPWQTSEQTLAEQLADAYAHAWVALVGEAKATRAPRRFKALHGALLALTLLALLCIPVRQSVLAPAQVVPLEPDLIAAPLDGVVASFAVEPNQQVQAGQELFRFEDTNLRSRRDVAQRTLDVAKAELHRASQGAFTDRESSSQLALLKARVSLRQAELDYAQTLLERVVVRAERAGVAVFSDQQQWIGRPVTTGERIMVLADPAKSGLRIDLPVGQSLQLEPEAEVVLFLDSDPLRPVGASLQRASYEAEPQADGTLAYRLDANFLTEQSPPRLGLRGTAKIYGESAPVFMYLFRRPLSALRQTIGW